MSPEPDACVSKAKNVFAHYGAGAMLVAKFVPGLTTVMPPLAGVVAMGRGRFALYGDSACLVPVSISLSCPAKEVGLILTSGLRVCCEGWIRLQKIERDSIGRSSIESAEVLARAALAVSAGGDLVGSLRPTSCPNSSSRRRSKTLAQT